MCYSGDDTFGCWVKLSHVLKKFYLMLLFRIAKYYILEFFDGGQCINKMFSFIDIQG